MGRRITISSKKCMVIKICVDSILLSLHTQLTGKEIFKTLMRFIMKPDRNSGMLECDTLVRYLAKSDRLFI